MNLLFTALLSCILDSCHICPCSFFFIAAVPCHDVDASYFVPPLPLISTPTSQQCVGVSHFSGPDWWVKKNIYFSLCFSMILGAVEHLFVCLSFYFFLLILFLFLPSPLFCQVIAGLASDLWFFTLSWFLFLVMCLLWHWVPRPVAPPQHLLCRSVTQ